MLADSGQPCTADSLRSKLQVRNQRVVEALRQIASQGKVQHSARGYALRVDNDAQLRLPFPVFPPVAEEREGKDCQLHRNLKSDNRCQVLRKEREAIPGGNTRGASRLTYQLPGSMRCLPPRSVHRVTPMLPGRSVEAGMADRGNRVSCGWLRGDELRREFSCVGRNDHIRERRSQTGPVSRT
jgi:hypothetical protein